MSRNTKCSLWVVAYHFHPVWAGPAERFVRYTPGFEARGLNVTFLTVMRPGLPANELYKGVNVRRLGREEKQVGVSAFIRLAVSAALVEKPDVFLVIVALPYDFISLQRLRRSSVRSIFLNTMAHQRSGARNPLKRYLSNWFNRAFLKTFHHTVCSTAALAQRIEAEGVSGSNISIISNGVSLQRFVPASSVQEVTKLRRALNLPVDEKIALFVGLRIDRKGILELVRAWRIHKDRGGEGVLLLVGDEQRAYAANRQFYRQLDQELSDSETLKIIIHPPSGQIEQYFKASDLFVFLSKLEGMPNVLTEAMACRLPILMTRFEGFSETWGRDGREFRLTERDPQMVAGHLTELITNDELRLDMAEKGLEWVQKNHDLELSLDRFTALFRDLSVVQEDKSRKG